MMTRRVRTHPAGRSRRRTPDRENRETEYGPVMCRSIKTLREPYASDVTDDDVRAAALQYVRKVSGFRSPSTRNAEAFERAVEAVAAATQALLDDLRLRHVSRD